MEKITIKVFEGSDEPGFFYDIYERKDFEDNGEDAESLDGGFCTSTVYNAVEMAFDQALSSLKLKEGNKVSIDIVFAK